MNAFYNEPPRRRDWDRARNACPRRAVVAGGILALTLGACSLTPAGLSDDGPPTTGTIRRIDSSPLSPDLGPEDWRRAKSALGVALDPQGSGAAVKWDNPDTEIAGSFTPVAQPYVQSNEVCRAFLASITLPGRTSTLQGTACRLSAEEWQLKDVRPWKKPA